MDSILFGEESYVEETFLHCFFEESIIQNQRLDKIALLYEGKENSAISLSH